MATTKPVTRERTAWGSIPRRGCASAKQIAAMGENSGPTTIAPTMRIGWSRMRPAPAIRAARVMNATNAKDNRESLRNRCSTETQTTPSSGAPGAAAFDPGGLVGEDRVDLLDADRAAVLDIELAQLLDHPGGVLAGDVGKDETPLRLGEPAWHDRDVGDRLVGGEQLDDRVGQVAGYPEAEVQHGVIMSHRRAGQPDARCVRCQATGRNRSGS